MRVPISYTALGLALVAGAPLAHAQTVYTQPLLAAPAPVIVQPVEQSVQTTRTVQTVRPATSRHARQVITTRTVTRQLVPTSSVVARSVTTVPQPLYDEVPPATIAASSDGDYSRPLYDEVTTAPAVAAPAIQSQWSQPFTYRYVYESDRILVIDPTTGIAVQSIPR